MSRCFPYPPPGYSKNGATYEALIESIKLQKETEKSKAERKKEKRAKKEKKEKRKDKENEKAKKNSNGHHPGKTQKGMQSCVDFKDVHEKKRELTVEQLERSDLTEEHGQPVGTHKPSYSSDSTQNSNKRKRDDGANLPDGTNAKPIKIRLLKKYQGPDSSKETLCSNSGRTDPPNLCGADPRANVWGTSTSGRSSKSIVQTSVLHSKDRTTLVSSTGRTGLIAPSKPEHLGQKSIPSFSQTASLRTNNNDAPGLHLSGKRPTPPSVMAGLPLSHLDKGMPSSNLKKTELSAPPAPRPSNEVQVSGSKTEVVRPSRHEKKMRKKHSKYEKLVGSWVPPVLEPPACDVEDDWLSAGGKKVKTNRSLTDDVEMSCHGSASGCLWRPVAWFLPEADIYALPFTVPF